MIIVSRSLLFVLSSSVSLALCLSACNFREDKINESPVAVTDADLNYETVNARVITPYCLSCHSAAAGNRGGLNLETYSNLLSELDSVKRTVIDEQTMPPASSSNLSSSSYDLLKTWIEAGAPQ